MIEILPFLVLLKAALLVYNVINTHLHVELYKYMRLSMHKTAQIIYLRMCIGIYIYIVSTATKSCNDVAVVEL